MTIGADEVSFSNPKSPGTKTGFRDYDYLLVSSTSWTEDEDFSILLEALVKFDMEMRRKPKSHVKILTIITGKGPLKEFYLSEIAKLSLEYVNIKTAWLTAEDYPLLLGKP
jgi:beta-1,4-mannosyltransferase